MSIWLIIYKKDNMEGMAFVKGRDYTDAKTELFSFFKEKVNIIGIRQARNINPMKSRQVLWMYQEVKNG